MLDFLVDNIRIAVEEQKAVLKELEARVTELEDRFNKRFEPQWNCPNCGRFVKQGATTCVSCGRSFQRPLVS